jgi:hypothetical protein
LVPSSSNDYNHRINVIVTTESKQIQHELNEYKVNLLSLQDTYVPDFHFITNPFDVTQDTGYFNAPISSSSFQSLNTTQENNITVDDIMVSTLSSLQLQLYVTKFTIGNCCSNFHLVLKDLLNIGCGVRYDNINNDKNMLQAKEQHTFQCLQNHPNPKYRICCSWDKSLECQQRRQATQR